MSTHLAVNQTVAAFFVVHAIRFRSDVGWTNRSSSFERFILSARGVLRSPSSQHNGEKKPLHLSRQLCCGLGAMREGVNGAGPTFEEVVTDNSETPFKKKWDFIVEHAISDVI